MLLIRSSNCPRYFVPATIEAISSDMTRLSKRMRDTFRWTILKASPSTMADLPTPGSPMSTGLFFLRRLRIWARRSISTSRPITGSRRPSSAARVMSLPNLSSTGVSLPLREEAVGLADDEDCCWPDPIVSSSSSSSSSSLNEAPIRGESVTLASNL